MIMPSGCRYCGESAYAHAQSWSEELQRFHTYTQPTDRQVLLRMLARRAARPNRTQT